MKTVNKVLAVLVRCCRCGGLTPPAPGKFLCGTCARALEQQWQDVTPLPEPATAWGAPLR